MKYYYTNYVVCKEWHLAIIRFGFSLYIYLEINIENVLLFFDDQDSKYVQEIKEASQKYVHPSIHARKVNFNNLELGTKF